MRLAVVDQTRESLPNDKTAWDAIANGQDILTVGKFEMPSRAYLGRFNFKGGDQERFVGTLSGGERGRLHLAATLLKGGNVLLLDEPSNDLDVETLRALEEALLEFAGSALVICTIAGSSTASPRTSSRPRATRSGRSSRATSASTKTTRRSGSARKVRVRTGSATSR